MEATPARLLDLGPVPDLAGFEPLTDLPHRPADFAETAATIMEGCCNPPAFPHGGSCNLMDESSPHFLRVSVTGALRTVSHLASITPSAPSPVNATALVEQGITYSDGPGPRKLTTPNLPSKLFPQTLLLETFAQYATNAMKCTCALLRFDREQ